MKQVIGEGRYRLDEPIGYGGMATVFRAEDARLGRTVAVKVLADNLSADPTFRERFLREARLAARLAHRNVVRVFDVDESHDQPFIVMECVDGGTLADALRKNGPLPPARVADIARHVAAGLAHAHDAGLVHRDVKPGNLLLDRDGTVKIADFGIARAADSVTLTRTGAIIGTEAYLAPEQAAGLPASAAADVYAFGVVLYEALTGQRLAPGAPPSPDALASAGEPLGSVIARSLEQQPEARPSASEIATTLGTEQTGATDPDKTGELPATAVLAAPLGTPPAGTAVLPVAAVGAAVAPLWSRHRGRLLAVALGAALVALAVGLIAARPDPEPVRTTQATSTTAAPATTLPPTTSTALAVTVPAPSGTCVSVDSVLIGDCGQQFPGDESDRREEDGDRGNRGKGNGKGSGGD